MCPEAQIREDVCLVFQCPRLRHSKVYAAEVIGRLQSFVEESRERPNSKTEAEGCTQRAEPDKASETVGDQELVSNPSSDDGLLIHTAVGNAGGCGVPRRKRLGCMACAAASTRARSA